MLHIVSTLVVAIIALGLYFRHRQPDFHWRLMVSAFAIDLFLVLYIELTRHAVETVVTGFRPFLWLHAAISLSVLVLYVLLLGLGRRLLLVHAHRGGASAVLDTQVRTMHRNFGMLFCVMRGLNYVTALML